MLEENLVQYGSLGLWTIFNITLIWYFLKRDTARDEKLSEVIKNNTIALTKVYEVASQCQKNK